MKKQVQKKESRFRKVGIITIIAVYLLILVGGVVRSTGSGMGCPDWPKCFGNWVPPSGVEDLPANYQDIYAGKRALKNERFSGYLEFFGFSELAQKIRNDKTILIEREFNSKKTWTEYFNRLLGALVGILIFGTFLSSLAFLRSDYVIPVVAFLSFILVIFQGWIGSIVVSTNLLPWMITFHMFLALLLVALLIYMLYRASPKSKGLKENTPGVLKPVLLLCLLSLVIQIAVGTQVRESIDEIALALNFQNRNSWISELGLNFYFHRSFSLVILGLHLWLVYILWKSNKKMSRLKQLTGLLMLMIGLEILTGIIMAYFAIPAFAQPVHLLLSSLIFGVQFLILLMLSANVGENKEKGFIGNSIATNVY